MKCENAASDGHCFFRPHNCRQKKNLSFVRISRRPALNLKHPLRGMHSPSSPGQSQWQPLSFSRMS